MEYTLRVARLRLRGGMDTSRAVFDAPTVADAVAHATDLTEQILAGQPGVEILTNTTRGIVWSYRYKLPMPPGLLR